MAANLAMFRKGDLVRVRWRGRVLGGPRAVWVFVSWRDGLVSVRKVGMASPRMLAESEVELIDHDARW